MNIYRFSFAIQCPANDEQIIYSLEIQAASMIRAEHIVTEALRNESDFHEVLADRLFSVFGEHQVIKATHHGVQIETRRGFE